jgi:hypothetical protein
MHLSLSESIQLLVLGLVQVSPHSPFSALLFGLKRTRANIQYTAIQKFSFSLFVALILPLRPLRSIFLELSMSNMAD